MIRRVFIAAAYCGACSAAGANDWPYWRGPEQTGMSREKAPVTSWSEDGKNLLWKVPVGGRSTPVLMDGRLYLIGPYGEGSCLGERVVCLDAATGRTIWEHRFRVFLTDIVENRVGWTAVVGDPETGNVYAHGTGGEFLCFDRDGKVLWKHSLGEDFGRYSGYGGRLHTPIIDEDRVVISIVYILAGWDTGPNKSGHRYLAFDKRTGALLWSAMPGGRPLDTTYSVPVVSVINGKRMLIAGNADGNVYGMLARTGERVWTFRLGKRGLNSSVVVYGKYVYATHSEENIDTTEMGRVVCIDASLTGDITETGEVWRADGVGAGYASPAVANGRLYVITNSATLICYDAKTGKQMWEHNLGRVIKGSPTVTADGVIYAGEVNGYFHILKDEGDRCASLDVKHFTRPDKSVVEINGCPIVSNGRVYFMTRYDTYCLGAKDASASVPAIPPMLTEAAPDSAKPAALLVTPAEVTVRPGERIRFSTRLFDGNGRQISGPTATWSVSGVAGQCDSDGVFTASDAGTFSSGSVTAKAGALTAAARVRISPPLPIHETFDAMKPGGLPPGWVGADGKMALVERDGGIVLQKLAKSPSAPAMRNETFSGPPIPAGYTVQADMMAEPKRGRRVTFPDMGLINCRYHFAIEGEQLELSRWKDEPLHGLRKTAPFEMQAGLWYRVKMRVDVKDGTGLVRGKVWPTDQDEPQAWSIEMTDPCPNTEGSPGLYGYSKGTTVRSEGALIFYDNYQVYENE